MNDELMTKAKNAKAEIEYIDEILSLMKIKKTDSELDLKQKVDLAELLMRQKVAREQELKEMENERRI